MGMEKSSMQALHFAPSATAVLFVDPDVDVAQRLAHSISHWAMTAVVPSVHSAMQAIRAHVPTIVVTELDLPDAHGFELIQRLHADPATRRVLIMVTTRRTSIQDKVTAFQVGADDFLVKPFDPQQFLLHLQLLTRFRSVTNG